MVNVMLDDLYNVYFVKQNLCYLQVSGVDGGRNFV